MKKIAALIPNYNMPERADALAKWINFYCDNVEVIVVDNGTDFEEIDPSYLTRISLYENIQTTGAWLMGMYYADMLERKYKGSFFGYWTLITSAEFIEDKGHEETQNPLIPMIECLNKNYNAVGVSPALTLDSTTSWEHMKKTDATGFRRTWMLDNICTLWRADWFNSIGRFDPNLIYAWGIDLETSYKARKQGKSLWIAEDVQIKKVTDIGYTMGRMGMSAEERKELARENMDKVFTDKYGSNWKEIMYAE